MDITFPNSPSLGQEYSANAITYVWLGDRWSSKLSTSNGQPILDGGFSDDEYNENIDQILDGGGA